MLAQHYRFTAYNALGQTIASAGVVIKGRRWKFDSTGALSYEASEASLYSNASTIANGVYDSSSGVDNSTSLYVGGDFTVVLTAPASSAGSVSIYYGASTDGGTTFPDAGSGVLMCVIPAATSGTFVKAFSIG